MKKLFFSMLLACMSFNGFSQERKSLPDGLYIVDSLLHNNTTKPNEHQALVGFDEGFKEDAPDAVRYLLINTAEFVPLELAEQPVLVQQTEGNTKLQISFSRHAADKLEKLTGSHLMRQATLIVSGKAITLNKIKAVIKGGKLEVTSSSPGDCERLYNTLIKQVKH